MKNDIKRMERDILGLAYTYGDTESDEVTKAIRKKYGCTREAIYQITIVLDRLVEKRYLSPFFDSAGRVVPAQARGITPEGYRGLWELKHPIRAGIGKHKWDGTSIVATLVGSGIVVAAILIVNLILNTD